MSILKILHIADALDVVAQMGGLNMVVGANVRAHGWCAGLLAGSRHDHAQCHRLDSVARVM